jgi:hypothetical protein
LNLDLLTIVFQDTQIQRDYARSLREYGPREFPSMVVREKKVSLAEKLNLMLDEDDDEDRLFRPDGHHPLAEYCYQCGEPAHSGRCQRNDAERPYSASGQS